MPTPAPFSLRLSELGREALSEAIKISGYKRSTVVEIAVRQYLERLKRDKKNPKKIVGSGLTS
jgi:metal-responsive CopG/Arc/MetJ family transcriptional regulator